MATTPATYSSAHMRERDKLIEGKYQKELYTLQRKIDKLRYANDDTLKQLFDMQARALRLANSLGFKDVTEAQVYIDTADHEIGYKECFEEVASLKAHMPAKTSRSEDTSLQARFEALEKENAELKLVLEEKERESSERGSGGLELQLSELQKRYDDLLDTYERATEKSKSDYKKWMGFDAWLFSTDTGGDSTSTSAKKRRNASIVRKRRLVRQMARKTDADLESTGDTDGKDCPPPRGGIVNPFLFKWEDHGTPGDTPQQKNSASTAFQFKFAATPESARTLVGPQSELSPAGKNSLPSSSPSIFLCTSSSNAAVRGAIAFKPIPFPVLQPKQASKAEKGRDPVAPISSDTEEDTQAPKPPEQIFKVPEVPALASSETEDDTQPPSLRQHLPTPKSRPRPSTIRKYGNTTELADSSEPPRKIRRIEAVGVLSTPKSSRRTPNMSANASPGQYLCLSDTRNLKKKAKDKGVDKENQTLSTPASSDAQGRATPQDQSTFKGRERYAKEANSTKTINSKYEIDPFRNGGLKYQYDEVVRRKEDRKKMDAGDCECCRDYYEAVGPLPPRLQPPLWRSPSKSEVIKKATRCAVHKRASDSHGPVFDGSGDFEDESQFGISDGYNRQVEDHKKAISRHRHQWARANTPPGYWNIGFPDTQEAAKINEKAEEMHRKKQEEVERSVNRGEGKYRRRS